MFLSPSKTLVHITFFAYSSDGRGIEGGLRVDAVGTRAIFAAIYTIPTWFFVTWNGRNVFHRMSLWGVSNIPSLWYIMSDRSKCPRFLTALELRPQIFRRTCLTGILTRSTGFLAVPAQPPANNLHDTPVTRIRFWFAFKKLVSELIQSTSARMTQTHTRKTQKARATKKDIPLARKHHRSPLRVHTLDLVHIEQNVRISDIRTSFYIRESFGQMCLKNDSKKIMGICLEK